MFDLQFTSVVTSDNTLEESSFRWIINQDNNQFYYCTLHSNEKNIHLETIEHHIICSNDHETHKTEIKKMRI